MVFIKIKIGNRGIGAEYPCFIIAEIGINHNGSLELAKKMIRVAAEVGADAVKFQNFKTEDFLSDRKLTITYKSWGRQVTEPLWDVCKRSEFRREWIPELKQLCDCLGVEFFSTPTSERGVDDLINAGVRILKNGSDYLTHIPLLRYMGNTGVPVIVSTGMGIQEDVDDAVSAVTSGGKSKIILLHCTSIYPTEDADVNLRRMVALREQYNVPVGFSDHTRDWKAAVQAVTLGACIIEKHFTINRELHGPDQWFSTTPEDLKILVNEVRAAEMRMGCKSIKPSQGEIIHKDEWRIGLVAARDLNAGDILRKEDVTYRKPALGLLPKHLDDLLGKKIAVDIRSGEPLMMEQFF